MASSSSDRPNVRQALELAGVHFLNLVELGILKTFIDYKVFDLIPEEASISLQDLAAKTGGEEALLERFSNYLIAAAILKSPTPGHVAHTARSHAYKTGGIAAMFLVHVHTFLLHPVACWPAFFEKNGLREPKHANVIPLGLATGHPDLGLYDVLDAEPKLAELFNRAQAGSAGIYSLKNVYDFGWMQAALARSGKERVAIVDIGGGSGLALRDIVADNTFLDAAQCAVLDLPKTIAGAKRKDSLGSIQPIPGSMLEPLPQPIRNAVVYQFRRVLSDFLNDAIVLALENARAACGLDSRVLIIEELLHGKRSKFFLAQDISVMNFGGKRRSEAMFRKLAEQAGFRVNAVFEDDTSEFGVLELIPV